VVEKRAERSGAGETIGRVRTILQITAFAVIEGALRGFMEAERLFKPAPKGRKLGIGVLSRARKRRGRRKCGCGEGGGAGE
jgi:hypothetical protein